MNKKENIAYMINELFHSKGRVFPIDSMETWIKLLLVFDENELRKAFFDLIISSESFPNVGMILDLMTGTTSNDASKIWNLFEYYCTAVRSYRYTLNEDDEKRCNKLKDKLGGNLYEVAKICSLNSFLDSDKTQKGWWKAEFIKSFTKNTSKVLNYLTDNKVKGIGNE